MTAANHEVDGKRAQQAYRAKAGDDFVLFAQGLHIPSAEGRQLFARCMTDFQLECFRAISLSLHALRDGRKPPVGRWWWERTKKAGKDSDIAVVLLWLLAFPRRPFFVQVGAADRDQATIVRRRMNDLLFHNAWLGELVEVSSYGAKSKSKMAQLEIVAADVAGSHGETPDLLVVNELSHIRRWEFVQNLLDNADGVPWGMVLIATNAGWKGTKAESLRKNAEASPHWQVRLWKRPAPWISEEMLADAKRRNLPSRYKRLWDPGVWVSGKGDALNEEDIDRCFCHDGPLEGPEQGWMYIGGLDLGITHDHAGLVVIGVQPVERRIRVAWLRGWTPDERTGEVDLIDVQDGCRAATRLFRMSWLGYDPTEARLMAQQLRREGVPMEGVSFASPANLTAMAQALVQVVEQGMLECYEDEEGRLRRDFGKFSIKEKLPRGYKLEAVSDEFGHADVGTGLAIALPKALEMIDAAVATLGPEEELAGVMEEDLTQEEVDQMPEELRAIYELDDDAGEDLIWKRDRRSWDDPL